MTDSLHPSSPPALNPLTPEAWFPPNLATSYYVNQYLMAIIAGVRILGNSNRSGAFMLIREQGLGDRCISRSPGRNLYLQHVSVQDPRPDICFVSDRLGRIYYYLFFDHE